MLLAVFCEATVPVWAIAGDGFWIDRRPFYFIMVVDKAWYRYGKQIILLNGPSGSGKSSLAKALQKRIEEKRSERYAVVPIDDFLKLSTEETIYEDDVFALICAQAHGKFRKHLRGLSSTMSLPANKFSVS